jgi:hypothetical protein
MPYREEKPLGDLIPPDRRRQKTIGLVVVGMLMGAGVLYAVQQATKDAPTVVSTTPPPPSEYVRTTLNGPNGTFVIPTPGKKTVMHVWKEACADCMPAFEAIASIERQGGLGSDVFVVNVAYGTADPNWAKAYGVSTNLTFDYGGVQVVRPLGISSFTTLVIDEQGKILARDRPDRPGYVERIRALVDPGPLTQKDVEDLVATKHESIRDRCWNRHRELSSADVTISAVVGADGRVVAATSNGTHAGLTSCIENEVKGWRFRPSGSASTTVDIPFKLRRDQ